MPDAPSPSPRWLSLGPASRLVGVDPDTLRRWADDGRIEAYLTPGGHRRFERRSIEQLVATRRAGSRPLASLGASPDSLARAYRRSYDTDKATGGSRRTTRSSASATGATGAGWSRRWSPTSMPMRATARRATGRRRMPRPSSTTWPGAWPRGGTSLTEAVALFVAARRPFLDALTGLGRRRTLDAARLAALYDDASGLLDRLLLRLIATFQEATAR